MKIFENKYFTFVIIIIIMFMFLSCWVGPIPFKGDDLVFWSLSFNKTFLDSILSINIKVFRPFYALFFIVRDQLFGSIPQFHFFFNISFGLLSSIFFFRVISKCFNLSLSPFFPAAMFLNSIFFSWYFSITMGAMFSVQTMLLAIYLHYSCKFIAAQKFQLTDVFIATVVYLLSILNYETLLLLPVFTVVLAFIISNKQSYTFKIKRIILINLVGFLQIFLAYIVHSKFLNGNTKGSTFDYNKILSGSSVLGMLKSFIYLMFDPTLTSFSYAIIVIFFIVLVWLLTKRSIFKYKKSIDTHSFLNVVVSIILFLSFFYLSVFPHLLAGYVAEESYLFSSRYVSASVYVFFIFLGYLSNFSKHLHTVVNSLLIVIFSGNVIFAVKYLSDIKKIGFAQRRMLKSIVFAVPEPGQNANFLFIDLQKYLGNKIEILSGVDGTKVLPNLIYNRTDLIGGVAYSSPPFPGTKTIVSNEYLIARSVELNRHNLIIMKCSSDKFKLSESDLVSLEFIFQKSVNEHLIDADWTLSKNNIIESNLALIRNKYFTETKFMKIFSLGAN